MKVRHHHRVAQRNDYVTKRLQYDMLDQVQQKIQDLNALKPGDPVIVRDVRVSDNGTLTVDWVRQSHIETMGG